MNEDKKEVEVETKVENTQEAETQQVEGTKKEEETQETSTTQEQPSGTSKETQSTKKVQSSEENARYAELRRQNEEQRKRIEALESEKRESVSDSALKELGLTREDLKDEENLSLANAYIKALANGAENPKASAYETLFKSKRESAKKAKEEADNKAKLDQVEKSKINEDKLQFSKEFPDVNIAEITKSDSDFRKTFSELSDEEMIGYITKYYRIYAKMKGLTNKPTESDKAKSTPFVSGTSANATTQVSEEDILKMSQKDYEKWRREQLHKH